MQSDFKAPGHDKRERRPLTTPLINSSSHEAWTPELQARRDAETERLSDPTDWRDIMRTEYDRKMLERKLARELSPESVDNPVDYL